MRYYSKEQLWIEIEENFATIGICRYFIIRNACITYIQIDEPGNEIKIGNSLFTLENDKSAIDFTAPVTGVIIERNNALINTPSLLSSLTEDECWICRIKVKHVDYSFLMTLEEYNTFN